jgi:hypothetical protein
MPFAFEEFAVRSQMPDNSADFVGGKSRIDGDREVMQPELGFEISGPDVDMRRLPAFVRIEERAIRSPTEDGRHSGRFQPLDFRLERKAQLRAFLVGQPVRHLRKDGPVKQNRPGAPMEASAPHGLQ